ncbi:MAG: hypothetical protein IM583_01330 [Pseudanabaena sp. M114S2SP2A07QC]|nr:hypothetical protein [Pseudanabaena sp. M090S1SP2A07QC]MCA6507211.1 hypothetical protein [Pseudanabaena sp. M172S2SP2A07QC]MCA6523421.1 hypothetical protein [Pseudanabaena sp. M051S1SP2A07QC]MCA6526330.1 hypothetical protein [Pseudanabaena sp. M179S2SP2A07QC]MCA6533990.1 hypothetical protein [Pseudanabaena sp. M176S2SP2A07QC]MCA6538125.1 hypothetical protein [Pseudanabaena sp. M037S2SP2A07QC]MCA6555293.1 hypothetical protein [Pseudanabaena sp. M114S2SP2A07QC]MCA6562349.1 hypothetical prot
MAELRSAIFWVLNCPIYLLRCYSFIQFLFKDFQSIIQIRILDRLGICHYQGVLD